MCMTIDMPGLYKQNYRTKPKIEQMITCVKGQPFPLLHYIVSKTLKNISDTIYIEKYMSKYLLCLHL